MGHSNDRTGDSLASKLRGASTVDAVPLTEASNANEAKDEFNPETEHEYGQGHPQVFHGPFSDCSCQNCVEDAKKEAEKRFDNNTLAFGYIKKLESLVNKLQLETNGESDGDRSMVSYRNDIALPPKPFTDLPRPSFGISRHAGGTGPPRSVDNPRNTLADRREDAEGSKELRVEVKRMKKLYNQFGDPSIVRDRAVPNALSSTNLPNDCVLSVFREHDKKGAYWRRSIEICSPSFIDLLRSLIYSDVGLPASDDILRLKEPFMPLFHNRTKLLEHLRDLENNSKDSATSQTNEHSALILAFLHNECQDVVKVQQELEPCDPSTVIKYEHAWLLYAPGTVVFSKENGEYEAFVIESIRGCQRHQPNYNSRYSHSSMEITCWSINYDGEIFGRVWTNHYIGAYDGLKEVSSLELVPGKFLRDKESVKTSLLKRGQQFWGLQGQCFREYSGEVWSSHMDEDPIRVMVDHLTFQRRSNWPIEIDRKRGPADAQSKNWRENRFTATKPRGRRRGGAQPPNYNYQVAPPPQTNRSAPGPHNHTVFANGDQGEQDMPMQNSPAQQADAYVRVDCDRPPQASNQVYKKYDVLKPETEPDEMTKLLCPQIVHGYCLREKVWSE